MPGRTDNLWMNPVQGEVRFLTREGGNKVERMQQTKLIISPERADFWLLGPFLISSVTQSINQSSSSSLLQNGLGKCSGRATDGSQQAFWDWANFSVRTWDKAHAMAHAARCDMACVCDVNSFGGGPSWDPCLCRSLPLQKRDKRQASSRRPLGAGGEFSSARGCQ